MTGNKEHLNMEYAQFKIKQNVFHHGNDQTLDQFWNLHSWRYPKIKIYVEPALIRTALSSGLRSVTSGEPFQSELFCDSVSRNLGAQFAVQKSDL